MLRLREILRRSFLAQFFVHLFIFNFFTGQCLAMLPQEVVIENFHSNIHALLDTFDNSKGTVGINLKRTEKTNELSVEVTKTDSFGKSQSEIFRLRGEKRLGKEYIDLGYGDNLYISDETIYVNSFFAECLSFLNTDLNVEISNFAANQSFVLKANKITVKERLSTDFSLSLFSKEDFYNTGTILAPLLNITAGNVINKGRISGRVLGINSLNLRCGNDSSIFSSGSATIKARNEMHCDSSSIVAKKLNIQALNVSLENKSYMKSSGSFNFFGNTFLVNDSMFCSNEGAKFFVHQFYLKGEESSVVVSSGLDISSLQFENEGRIQAKSVFVSINRDFLGFEIAKRPEINVRRQTIPLVGVGNKGSIIGDTIDLSSAYFFVNGGRLEATNRIRLFSVFDLVNLGNIVQRNHRKKENSSSSSASKISHSVVRSESGIVNKEGVMDFYGELTLKGESFNNTNGELRARSLQMLLAIDDNAHEEVFRENPREKQNHNEESNPYSQVFQRYVKTARFVGGNNPKSEKKEQEETSKDASETDKTHEKKLEPSEIGHLVNNGGIIEVDEKAIIRGSGAIYNSEGGRIQANALTINIFGRLLNQTNAEILSNAGNITSEGKIFNTLCAKILGKFNLASHGFENGIGSLIQGEISIRTTSVPNDALLFNFGNIHATSGVLSLSSDYIMKNTGNISSDTSISMEAPELRNDAGKISANAVDLRGVQRVLNKKGGEIEAKVGNVSFKDGVSFFNQGRISSTDLILRKFIPSSFEDETSGGILFARHLLCVNTDYPLKYIKGIMQAPESIFEINAEAYGDNAVILNKFVEGIGLRTAKVTFLFPNSEVRNRDIIVFDFDTTIIASKFRNTSLLRCLHNLTIETTKYDVINSVSDEKLGWVRGLDPETKRRPVFPLQNDYDISSNYHKLDSQLGGSKVYFAHEKKKNDAMIVSVGDLTISSKEQLRNLGFIESKGKTILKGKSVQNGWAYETVRQAQLPGLNFSYDYMESQGNRIISEQQLYITAEKFLNTFGTINAQNGLIFHPFLESGGVFLNYAGNIDVQGDCLINSIIFANLIGTVKTSRMDENYWLLDFCNTPSPMINVHNGRLDIHSPYAINSAGHIFAKNGVFIDGSTTPTERLNSVIDITSKGFLYGRMFSVNEYNYGQYADRILGMSLANTNNGAIIRATLPEERYTSILPASISSQNQVIIEKYNSLKSTGNIHAGEIHIHTGTGMTELGYTGNAILPSISGFAKTIDLFPYINSLAENQLLDIAENGDYIFKSTDGDLQKLPFAVIETTAVDLMTLKLPFSPTVLEVMLTKQLQSTIGTAYIPEMPTMLAAAELAYANTPSVSKESGERFQWLQQHTDKDISIVSEKNATHGLFFRPHKLGAYIALFPELHLLPQSVHSALSNPAGATVAEGKKADIVIDTDGFLHATGQLHADDNIFARAKRGALFETSTYDAMAITQNEVEYTERSGLFGLDHDTVRYRLTEWHQIKRAREPMLVTTTRGDFVIVIPNNEEASHFEEMVSDINTNEKRKDRVKEVGSTVEFKGTVTDIAGDIKVIGSDAEVILSPLEIATVVPCPQIASANRISTTLPVFLRTVLKAKGVEADVRVFKNNGSQIKALNDVVIKASDRIEFNTETRKFTLAEGVTTHASMFSTSTSYHRIDDVTFSAPTTEAGGNIHFQTDTANLTGQFSADNDIILNARIAELKSVLAYGTEEFHSKASSWISSSSYDRFATFSRISPTIFQSHGDFIADLTDIYFEHSIQKSCHNERITASRIDSSPLEVHETVTESRSSSGFDFFLPLAVYAPVCDGRISDALDAFWQQSSLLTATHSLLNSRRGADLAANGISVALSAYSSLNALLSKGIGGGLSLFGIGNFGFHSSQIDSEMKHDFTVASTIEASGSITWEARSGDIRIAHRIAKAGENQRYTASGNILVEPGHDAVSMSSSSSSSGMSFNVFTKDISLNFSHGETSAVSTDYLASGFHSVGDNVFSAGNGIHIIVPQISGTRNTFDALVVNLENRANIHESHSSSSGVGLSTNLAESAGLMASMNLGASGSRNTYLNEAYIRGAVDFTRAEVTNQGCCVMDITNSGASYRYVPMEEVHESSSFAIGLSGLDLSSADAFAYSLGRGLASAATSAGVGMLASEAGLGGFVSSLAASLAGAYVNTELLPQEGRNSPSESRLPSISTNSNISFEHNGSGLRAENLDFNKEEVNQLINDIKTYVFNEALDQNLDVGEAVERVEVLGDWAEKLVTEAKEEGKSDEEAKEEVNQALPVAHELVKIDQMVKKEPDQGTFSQTTESSASSTDTAASDLLWTRLMKCAEDAKSSQEVASHLYFMLQMNKFAENPSEENRTMLTKTISVLKKIGSAIGAVFGPQEVEAMNPAVVPATAMILSRLSTWIMLNQPRIQGFLSTVAGIERLGQIFERSKAKSSSSSAPARGSMTSGGGSVLPPDPEKDPKKERKGDTKSDQENRWNAMKESGEWEYKPGYSKSTLRNKKTGDLAQKSIEKWEIEVFKKNGQHKGIIRPSEGVIRTEFAKPGRTIK